MTHTLLPKNEFRFPSIRSIKEILFSFKGNWRYLFMLTCILAISRFSAQACVETLYEERFNYSDETRYNSNWIIDITGVTLTGPDDYFAVYDDRWKAKDLDGDAYWKTLSVNIAGRGPVTASLKIEGTGDMESDDYIKVYYILDGGTPVLFSTNGAKYDAFSAITVTQGGLVGSTLQIKVQMKNTSADEKHYIDDVVITGACCDAQIDNVILYNLSNGTTYDIIQDGESYSLGSLPSSWNIEALVSGTTAESVQFSFSGNYTASNIENTIPFRAPTDASALNLGLGSYTLVVKLFSSDNAGGSTCDETTLHFSIVPSCLVKVTVTSDKGICDALPLVLKSNVSDSSICTVPGTSDCNHVLANSGGWLESTSASTICGDNSGTKLWTQGGQGTSYITLDLGTTVPAGTQICASMKLEHCNNSSTSSSNAQISSSLSSTTGFVNMVSSLIFSQTSYVEFCYTLATSARYIKVLDNGNCAFRVDYVKATTPATSGGNVAYLWTGPGISGANNQKSVTVTLAGTYTVVVTDCKGCTATASYTKPPVLSVTAVSTNVTCYGVSNGAIDVTVTGGTSPYVYLWNDGATTQDRSGLAAGTYTVTATDANNCTSTISKTITQPVILGISGIVTNVTFTGGHDGAVNVTVTGGTQPYQYLWNDGVTTEDRSGLSAGTYTVTVTDFYGCPAQKSFTITQPPCSLSISATTTNATCYGISNGAIDVTVSGAQSTVTYLWNDGAITQDRNGLAAGTYTVTATDAGNCTATLSKTITQPVILGISGITTNVTFTGGHDGAVDVTVTGGTQPYHYLWNDGATTEDRTGLSAGTYTVTVTDNNVCPAQKTFTITQPPCNLSMTATTLNVTCYGTFNGSIDVTVSGAQGSVTYLWNDGATTQDRSGLAAGTYTVTATDAGNCTSTLSKTITQPVQLGITGIVTNVTFTGGHDGAVDVTVTGGTQPYHYLWNDGVTTEDRSGLAAGTYTVTASDFYGCPIQKSFTITQPPCSLSLSATTINVTCYGTFNGSIDVSVSGAQGIVTYLWNDGATTQDRSGLAAGTYTVTATDAGNCTATLSRTITQPSAVEIIGVVTHVSSNGGHDGSVNVTVTGGTPPYTYLWNDGVTTEDRSGLTAGTYTVTVSDYYGCPAQKSFTITQPECDCVPPTTITPDSVSAAEALICWDENACAKGYIVAWRTQGQNKWLYSTVNAPAHCLIFTNKYDDIYEIQIATICLNGDTSEYGPIFIFETYPSCLAPTNPYTDGVKADKATMHWSAVSDATKYSVSYRKTGTTAWTKKSVNGSKTSFIAKNLLPSTQYEWKVQSKCIGDTRTVTGAFSPLKFFTTSSLKVGEDLSTPVITEIKVYPNPASDMFTFEFDANATGTFSMVVENVLGQVIYNLQPESYAGSVKQQVDLGHVSEGLYILHFYIDGKEYSKQLLIQHTN